ncbi:MAG: hypothetical protein ABW167_18550 [Baekduia sp.]
MTKIPPEHTAARALEDAFRTLGERRARARRPQQRRRPMPRSASRIVVIALTTVLLVAVAATGTKVFLGDGPTIEADPAGLTGRVHPTPSYRQLALASAPDPVERQPWGLRLLKSANGDTCLTLGRVVGGRLGVVREGQFRELPTRAAGMCAPLEERHIAMAVRDFTNSVIAGSRGVLFGIVDRTVTRLRLRAANGSSSAIPVQADGTFVVVRPGWKAFRQTELVAEGSTGQRTTALGG